ncbi:MAG: polysaccharide deacetylase family protein [Balneolaceae bacterium]|nr:MAG: polysaccharide deacetylase family protein [Balneolaceae bacterium]
MLAVLFILITLFPALQPETSTDTVYVPVLCYHDFYSEGRAPGTLSEKYARFEDLLKWLQAEGYRSLLPGPDDTTPPGDGRNIIFTFDDGNITQLRAALLLEQYGFRGIFFVIPAFIDQPGKAHFTSGQIRSLAQRGHQIGIHGFEHKSMIAYGSEIAQAADTSITITAAIIGKDAARLAFAFPYGHYSRAVVSMYSNHFSHLYTVNPGYWNTTSTLIPRMLITPQRDPDFYRNYIISAAGFRPLLRFLDDDASSRNVIQISSTEKLDGTDIYLLTPAADQFGLHYNPWRIEQIKKTAARPGEYHYSIDLGDYLQTYHKMENAILAMALVGFTDNRFRFMSDGYLFRIREISPERPGE